jgi:hypothetical protein
MLIRMQQTRPYHSKHAELGIHTETTVTRRQYIDSDFWVDVSHFSKEFDHCWGSRYQ